MKSFLIEVIFFLCIPITCIYANAEPNSPVNPDEWKAVEESGLEEQLKNAPTLKVADVLPGPTRIWYESPIFAPNQDNETWDMILVYQASYHGAKQVVIHDFGTGKTTIQELCTDRGDNPLTRERYGFHLRPHYWSSGKLLVDPSSSNGMRVLVYDPQKNKFVYGDRPFGEEIDTGAFALGEDGMLYGIGWPEDKSGFVAFSFNPKTYEAKRFPVFGPANENRGPLYIDCVMDGEWLYAGIGQNPWHLVAYNFKTQVGRVLAETEKIQKDQIKLESLKGGARGWISNAVRIDGIDDFSQENFAFWLDNGKVYKREGDIPPWSDQPAQLREKQYQWDENCWFMGAQAHWGDFVPEPGPPEVDYESRQPNAKGEVKLRYRKTGSEKWQILPFTVDRYPGVVRHMIEIDDHRIFATDEGYGQAVIFDVAKNDVKRLGDTSDLSPYSLGLYKNKLYVSGYPSSRLYEFDLTRPFTLDQINPSDYENEKEMQPNPREVAVLGTEDLSDIHCPMAGTIAGRDGRIYNAGITYGRRREGGGMGWYDPKTGEMGGIGEPIRDYRVFWMTGASDNRYILLSSKPTTADVGKLFCWDTEKHQVIYSFEPPGQQTPGPIAEALPGLVIGHTKALDSNKGVLFGFRADTGDILWTKEVPEQPITSFSRIRRHGYSFRRGPNGKIWAFLGETLVRIHPKTIEIEVIGQLPNGVDPAQIVFANNRMFIAGGKYLRRFETVTLE